MVARKTSVLPGKPVRGSRSGRPIMALLDLLGRRWTLRIVWELGAGPKPFRRLQDDCGVSPSVLNTRLGELRAARLVETAEGGYRLTPAGSELLLLFEPISRWADSWSARLAPPRASRP